MVQISLSREYTTIAKGVAILCVILSHLGKPLGIPYVFQLGGIGVAIFLFLSGYGINESVSRNGVRLYWFKRVMSVFLVYFLFEVCRLAMSGWPLSIGEFVWDVCLIAPVAPMTWFLNYLLIWYVLYYVAWSLMKIKIPMTVTLGCAAIVLFLYFPHRLQSEQSLSFLLGVLYSMFKQSGKPIPKHLTSILAQVFVVVSGVATILLILTLKKIYFTDEECSVSYNAVSMAAKLAAIPVMLILSCWIKHTHLMSFFVSIVGIYSYELYLVHATTVSSLQASLPSISTFVIMTCALAFTLHGLSSTCRKSLTDTLVKASRDCGASH